MMYDKRVPPIEGEENPKALPQYFERFLEIKNIKALTIYGVFERPLIHRTAKAVGWIHATMLNKNQPRVKEDHEARMTV
jgi:hypothetical protein